MIGVCKCLAVLAVLSMCTSRTWPQAAEQDYGCEANPTGNPIGGGDGYTDVFTTGDIIVRTKEELLDGFKQARAGQVIFIPDGVEIDMTGRGGMVVPAGVTLAGTRGLNGSLGARIFTTWREGPTLMSAGGDGVRITGLRFEGPYAGDERTAFGAAFFVTCCFATEIDNCEICNWNAQGISVGTGASQAYIHHSYIHHCQKGGLGYGVVVGAGDVRIIANKFDYCRHHVAATGSPGCSYEAAWNLIMPNCTSYCFDMHGGADRGDGTDIGGDWILIHHNTFQGQQCAVGLYGVPSDTGEIHHNWFTQELDQALRGIGNTRIYDNVYGPEKTPQGKPMEFVDRKLVECQARE